MAYKREVVGGVVYCAIDACDSIAIVRAMQLGGGTVQMIDSCTKSSK